MAGLLDFFQSASNSVASNVSAPVDGLAWALRKLGVPMPANPMGGSDWMQEKGLTKSVQQSGASLAGDAMGMIFPMVAAAKAPQIAKGVLQMGENAMMPRTLNPQTGAVLWHGTPHKFDKFDSSKIGTGEGAQVYGNGLYFAESQDVAKGYQKTVSADGFLTGDGRIFDPRTIQHLNVRNAAYKGDLDGAITRAQTISASDSPAAQMAASDLESLRQLRASGGLTKNEGALYKVDLPDEHIAKMLDWDKPLSQQHPSVQQAFQSPQVSTMVDSLKKSGQLGDYSAQDMAKLTGEDWHDILRQASGDSNNAPAEFMRQQGIPGIRYLDGSSRGPTTIYDVGSPRAGFGPYSPYTTLEDAQQQVNALKGYGFSDAEMKVKPQAQTSNFVVFPGNEGLLSILERNGQAIK